MHSEEFIYLLLFQLAFFIKFETLILSCSIVSPKKNGSHHHPVRVHDKILFALMLVFVNELRFNILSNITFIVTFQFEPHISINYRLLSRKWSIIMDSCVGFSGWLIGDSNFLCKMLLYLNHDELNSDDSVFGIRLLCHNITWIH